MKPEQPTHTNGVIGYLRVGGNAFDGLCLDLIFLLMILALVSSAAFTEIPTLHAPLGRWPAHKTAFIVLDIPQ